MNIKQIQWTMNRCNELLAIPQSYPLDQETAEKVKETSERFYALSKCNDEVRPAIVETAVFIDNLDRAHREYRKKMEDIVHG